MKWVKGDLLLAGATGASVVLVLALMLVVLGQVAILGAPSISATFLTEGPSSDLVGGGIWPAIWGTVLMTLLMTVAVVPVGILAGVPSIVFGLFGLGFFILFLGRGVDALLYDGQPVWGKPAVLWSSLTLAVLTLPVVIVTTEEALRSVPQDLRSAALALGATRFQTVFRIAVPNAKGGILTGIILAVSRGAGEVAPIIFTGAASYLPQLPTDLRDMYMHLGYHVYALSTQSPNVDAARGSLFGTVLVLLVITFTLNLTAMIIRARSRR